MICASNKNITTHYGESVTIHVASEYGQSGAFYVSKAGEAPVISKTFTISDGNGDIVLDDTETSIPLGDYIYSVVIDGVEYPSGQLPTFSVSESAKNVEV